MINSIQEVLLHWRWLIIALIGLTVVVLKVVEHNSGVALPTVAGVVLGMLVRPRPRRVQAMITSTTGTERRRRQRVLVVENESLLGAGIESLLTRETDLDLVGIASGNEADLIKIIEHSQPQVIILDEATYMTNSIRLLDLFRNYSELRLVLVNANDNLVHIYEKRKLLVSQAADLADIVRR